MDRKLTEKEQAFLLELRELMANHNAMLSTQNNRVCIDVDYTGDDDYDPVVLPRAITAFYHLDDFIEQNS